MTFSHTIDRHPAPIRKTNKNFNNEWEHFAVFLRKLSLLLFLSDSLTGTFSRDQIGVKTIGEYFVLTRFRYDRCLQCSGFRPKLFC